MLRILLCAVVCPLPALAEETVASQSKAGDAQFFKGNFNKAVAHYERMVELNKAVDRSHWRLGIAYFYAGQYAKAAAQFGKYHSFDNVDRENGIWRYFSQFKANGKKAAKKELLKYEKDDREPFGDVYRLFSGKITGKKILARINSAKINKTEREKQLFYAELYIGLNDAVEGRSASAKKHLAAAVKNTWPKDAGFGPNYMWHVGRLHLAKLNAAKKKPPAKSKATKRPNILFIYTDDHSHRTVSCYPEAYPWVKTPNIDALAKNGVRFSYAYIGTWCMPSRATLLTGHHPYGVQSMRMAGKYPGSTYDPKQCPFWPSVFRKRGYVTAQIGKWHTGTDTGAGRDWDHQIVWNRPRYPDNAGNYFQNQLIEFNGSKPKLVKGYSTDNYTKWADEFIRGKTRDKKKPWYLWVCYGAVHAPFTPAKRHLKNYPGIKVPTPKDIYPPRPGKPKYVRDLEFWVKNENGEPVLKEKTLQMKSVKPRPGIHGDTLTDWVRQYHQGVLAIDDGVGKLVQALKETGQYENTLIVFTSDQGFGWGQHGFRHKLAPYDATIRSPLIVSMPSRLPSGKVCPTPVGGVDLVPTFFRFAGFELPWKMHGHDLTPLLENPNGKWSHPVLTTLMQRKYGRDCDRLPEAPAERYLATVPWWISLRQGRYKYIRNLVAGETEELYDLTSDPDELVNLAPSRKHRATLLEFRAGTLKELRRTGAKIVDHLPAVRKLK